MLDIKVFASSSKGNCYLLHNEETKILLECGVDKKTLRNYLLSFNKMILTDLDCCLCSHIHSDHLESADYVSEYIDVYSTYESSNRYDYIKALIPLQAMKIGTIKILPIPVEHGKTENNAFVFLDKDSCIFFGTDFSLMTQNVSNFKFDKVYIECNYDDDKLKEILSSENDELREKHIRQVSTHMSKENCKTHLRYMNLSKCKEIVLLHASAFLINKIYTKIEFEKEFKIKTNFAKEN